MMMHTRTILLARRRGRAYLAFTASERMQYLVLSELSGYNIGRKPPPDDEDIGLEVQSEDSEDEPEWEVGVGTGDGMDEEGDEHGNPESEESEGEEEDVFIVDEGEELDKDI